MKKEDVSTSLLQLSSAIWTPVEEYNAIGDGVTDDQSAIQSAINSGKLVCLSPNKTYKINSSILIEEGETLFIPTSATLLFNAESSSYAAVNLGIRGNLLGNGRLHSTRYDWLANNWNYNSPKASVKVLGEGVRLEIGEIAGFEHGIDMGGDYTIVCCNINIGYFINILYCFLINPSINGCVNECHFHWNAMSVNWDNRLSFRSNSSGVYMDGAGEPNHNTFIGHVENYYIGLRLSGAFNRFLGLRCESCDYTVVINNPYTTLGTRYNTIFGEYGNANEFYNRILNQQTSTTIQYAVQIYGPEGKNWLNATYARNYYTFSDSLLKKDIQEINNALGKVLSLKGIKYKDKVISSDTEKDPMYSFGFVAQDLSKELPELISNIGSEKLLAIDYISLIPILVEAIKEQDKIITEVKNRLDKVELGE